jgi:hypothetical protein
MEKEKGNGDADEKRSPAVTEAAQKIFPAYHTRFPPYPCEWLRTVIVMFL